MSSHQGILARTCTLAEAHVHTLLDSAEDPEKMLEQMIRDYAAAVQDAGDWVSAALGELRLDEADHKEGLRAAEEWGGKALAASDRGDELRRAGQAGQADEFDRLAKVALEKQLQFEKRNAVTGKAIAARHEMVDTLREGMEIMKRKLDELQSRQREFAVRQEVARARGTMHDALRSFDLTDPASELGRFEAKIRREEAKAAGRAEPAESSTLDQQYQQLESLSAESEVAARLAALKRRTV